MILWRKIKQPRGIIFTDIPDKVTFGEIVVGNEELACSCVGKEHLRQGEQPSVHRPLEVGALGTCDSRSEEGCVAPGLQSDLRQWNRVGCCRPS